MTPSVLVEWKSKLAVRNTLQQRKKGMLSDRLPEEDL